MRAQIKTIKVSVKKLPHFDEELTLPFYGSAEAAGADVKACFEDKGSLELKPFERTLVPTGLSFEIPAGHEIQVRPRSGLSLKTGLVIANSPGTIDSDYRGELKIIVANFSNQVEVIEHGQRIAQLVIAPIYKIGWDEVEVLSHTQRSVSGFGSTGFFELKE
ncbi:MAG: dUTP diphosphatase [Halobacteriovoraceae bacterium]|nr:dUTP diphosphatase [Halobacteriovoraceae bacterium]